MSLTSQNLLTHSRISINIKNPHFRNPNFSFSTPSTHLTNPPNIKTLKSQYPNKSFYSHNSPPRAFESDGGAIHDKQEDINNNLDFDAILSIAEFLCLASSAAISFGLILNSQKPILVWLGNKVSVWQFALLVGGMVIGAMIRTRQWRRVCVGFSKPGDSGVNFVNRIEKLEEDLRSSATIIRVMSRQLEKLGTRFRVHRKALKEPIAETAALAQKNSEATRVLAMQQDILEKELCEIQNVLLAMQEQQQKQLELILAVAKNGKLWESKREPSQDEDKDAHNSAKERVKQMASNQIQAFATKKEGSNDKA